jgi:hypothetical protein
LEVPREKIKLILTPWKFQEGKSNLFQLLGSSKKEKQDFLSIKKVPFNSNYSIVMDFSFVR